MIINGDWKIGLDTVGYLGKHRDEKMAEWQEQYGGVAFGWQFGEVLLDFDGVCQVYEDAYYEFLLKSRYILADLIVSAKDVYDDEESNVLSGFDYRKQETGRTHIQDIAIRRSLLRLGLWFKGEKLIRIRQEKGDHSLSMSLSPGWVPFHRKDMIRDPQLEGWWRPDSVESFYQSNRVLLVRRRSSAWTWW